MTAWLTAGSACLLFSSSVRRRKGACVIAAASVCALALLLAGVLGMGPGAGYLPASLLALAAVIAALAASSGIVREMFAGLVSRDFGGRFEHMDRWIETAEKISSRLDVPEVKSFLAGMFGGTIGSLSVNVWVYEPASKAYVANSSRLDESLRRIRADHALIEHIKATGGAPFPLESHLPDEGIKKFAAQLDARVCAPLIAHKEITGFILAGGKRGGKKYTEYDLRLMRAVATQAAVQIKNIRLSEDLLDMKESDLFNRMSSFVAHDLKNLTNSLSLLSHNAKSNISDPAFQREALKAIDTTALKMRQLAERMAGALRGAEGNTSNADLRKVLARAAARLAPAAHSKLRVENGPPAFTRIDEEQIETVFLNMLTNASEATSEGEEIRVRFSSAGDTVSAVIEDNGSGIPMPFLENGLFRPFRTTKKDGFGIGLFQCRAVMEAHGGTIEVESIEGRGTSFTLVFQAAAAFDSGRAV